MDNLLNSKIDKQTIYDIYRACRLCGAGAGYKMPIIQNVVDLDSNGIELKHKIRDCVQIEVNSDDKMPPLICELCVDKVNDFYEFMEMCQQTNKRTRQRLGLPPQSTGKDSGDCILGVTEQVYGNEDSDEPLSGSRRPKSEPKVVIKVEKEDKEYRDSRPDRSSRAEAGRGARVDRARHRPGRVTRTSDSRSSSRRSRSSSPSPLTPPRLTRHAVASKEENFYFSSLRHPAKKSVTPSVSPKSILKKSEDTSRSKRSRDPPARQEVPQKKVKLAVPPSPKSSKAPRRSPPPPAQHGCRICDRSHATSQALANHMRSHTVGYTSAKMSCNPCQLWFPSADGAATHHKNHKTKRRPYRCRRCEVRFTQLQLYDEHIENDQCIPMVEVADVKCKVCWKLFATENLHDAHKCGGVDARPGGKCMKCKRTYALLKNLKKHEETCKYKRKGEATVDPKLLARLRPVRIRLTRCDPLLANEKGGHYVVSNIPQGFDVDPCAVYPYRRVPMVSIKAELADLSDDEDLLHWDSDSSCDIGPRTVESLITLSLKTIFSKKFLGKVPRKRRRVQTEKSVFDCMVEDLDTDFRMGIDNIIDNLGNDDNASVNSESLLCNDVIESNVCNDFNDDRQSLIVKDVEYNVSENRTVVEKDKDSLSTDCETDAEDDKDSIIKDKLNVNRVSSCNESVTECTKNNDYDESSTISDLDSHKDNLDDTRNSINDCTNRDTDIKINGEVNSEDLNDTDNINERNESDNCVGESYEQKIKSNEKLDKNKDQPHESVVKGNEHNIESNVKLERNKDDSEKCFGDSFEHIENNKKIERNNEYEERDASEEISVNNTSSNERRTENNDDDVTNENGENIKQIANNYEIVKNNEKEPDKNDVRNIKDDNESICNDIENKINDLIALRNNTGNDWQANNGGDAVNNDNSKTKNNDWSDVNSIEAAVNDKSCHSVKDDWSDINSADDNDATENNDVERDKISLEDLLSSKNPEIKSMDLDSISDEEFDFDA